MMTFPNLVFQSAILVVLSALGASSAAAQINCGSGESPSFLLNAATNDQLNNWKIVPAGTEICVKTRPLPGDATPVPGLHEVRDPKTGDIFITSKEAFQPYKAGDAEARQKVKTKVDEFIARGDHEKPCATLTVEDPKAPLPPGSPPRPGAPPLPEAVRAGSTHNGERPIQPIPASTLGGVYDSALAADRARVEEFLSNALAKREAIRNSAEHDHSVLSQPYRSLSPQQLDRHLARAEGNLNAMLRDLQNTTPGSGGMDSGDLARFQNIYRNALDKASAAREALREGGEDLGDAARDPNRHALAKTPALRELFDNSYSPTSQDNLIDRLIMLNGLDEAARAATMAKMRLAERQKLRLADGKTKTAPILHNGYIFGAGKSGLDCSSYVSGALPADIRKGHFTTLDFKAMWTLQKSGELPRPPRWGEGRAELVEKTSKAFIPVDLYMGEPPIAGDLLIYRLPGKPSGHVFIVKDYDPNRMVARVIEAAQSAGTIRERDFPLSVDPENHPVRLIRPGFFDLRLKPTDNSACKFDDKKKPAANRPNPGNRKSGGKQ